MAADPKQIEGALRLMVPHPLCQTPCGCHPVSLDGSKMRTGEGESTLQQTPVIAMPRPIRVNVLGRGSPLATYFSAFDPRDPKSAVSWTRGRGDVKISKIEGILLISSASS